MGVRKSYERDPERWPTCDADGEPIGYAVHGHRGCAFRVLGWETEPDEDTEWSGYEARTGKVLAVMVGDDYRWSVDPDDITVLSRKDYCSQCGQIGCGHDGYDRGEEAEA